MDTPVRRMIFGALAFGVIAVGGSIAQDHSPALTAAIALAIVVGAGLVIGLYLFARRGGPTTS